MGSSLSPLDIVQCRFPDEAMHGDPSKPGKTMHRVIVVRVILEADQSWAHVVFGTGQGTAQKLGPVCRDSEIDIDANTVTNLEEQTRFKFNRHSPLLANENWFPIATLKKGRVPNSQREQVLLLIKKFVPLSTVSPGRPEFEPRKEVQLIVKPSSQSGRPQLTRRSTIGPQNLKDESKKED